MYNVQCNKCIHRGSALSVASNSVQNLASQKYKADANLQYRMQMQIQM